MASSPERTCIGCRAVGPASEMLRLVAPNGRVVVLAGKDRADAAPKGKRGRGAWVHMACITRALERGALARAFRRQVEAGEQLTLLARAHGAPE